VSTTEQVTDFDLVILERIEGLLKKIRFREKIPLIGDTLTIPFRLEAVNYVKLLSNGGIHEFHERRRRRRNK